MKVKVLKRYVDKQTLELMEPKPGKSVEYTPERAKELEKGGYVEIIRKKDEGGE